MVDFSHFWSNDTVEEKRRKIQRRAKNEKHSYKVTKRVLRVSILRRSSWSGETQNMKHQEIKQYDERENPREGLESNLMFCFVCQVAPEPYENQNYYWKIHDSNDCDSTSHWALWKKIEDFRKLG